MPIKGTLTGSFSWGQQLPASAGVVATGGTESTWNGWKIHTFTSNGTFAVASGPVGGEMEIFVVGGGGPGGNGLGGGGGGGAVQHHISVPVQSGNWNVVVGAQTAVPSDQSSSATGTKGNDSILTAPNGTAWNANGGGLGGWWNGQPGFAGGCGGGASQTGSSPTTWLAGGSEQAGYGHRGGMGRRYPIDQGNNDHRAGGGGGGGQAGWAAMEWNNYYTNEGRANGGCGYYCAIDGTNRYWAGGGGGSVWTGNAWGGHGGLGGGGGANHHNNNNYYGSGGGSGLSTGGNGQGGGGDGGTNTGGGGGGSSGQGWGAQPGGRGASGIVIIRYREEPQNDTSNLGLTEATAASSAKAIKDAWNSAPTGTYWIKPSGQSVAYKVYCVMDIEGGGWELCVRTDSWDFGPNSGGTAMHGQWSGWQWTTKNQCDNFNTYYQRDGDSKTLSPSACLQNFNDVMVWSNGSRSKRCGYRYNSQQSPITTLLSSGGSKKANSLLFGSYDWTSSLETRSDTSPNYSGGNFFAFKAYSDQDSSGSPLSGGNPDNNWGWGKAQIGVGRDNNQNNYWGGGVGYSGPGNYCQLSGHWWGHGEGRAPHFWSGNRASGWNGVSIFVRKN